MSQPMFEPVRTVVETHMIGRDRLKAIDMLCTEPLQARRSRSVPMKAEFTLLVTSRLALKRLEARTQAHCPAFRGASDEPRLHRR